MDNNQNGALGWGDDISQDSQFVLLPAGDYDFTVKGFERGRYEPKAGSKIQDECPMAKVSFDITTPDGEVALNENFILHTKCEWKISELFICLGLKKRGQKVPMQWDRIAGLRGRCKVGTRQNDGKDYNEIKKFYDPAEKPAQGGGDWRKDKAW